jgi:hypothetical protein
MWKKIKAFFSNKIVRIVSWILLAICVASLIIGGATKAEIDSGITLIIGIISAVALFITFLSERMKE